MFRLVAIVVVAGLALPSAANAASCREINEAVTGVMSVFKIVVDRAFDRDLNGYEIEEATIEVVQKYAHAMGKNALFLDGVEAYQDAIGAMVPISAKCDSGDILEYNDEEMVASREVIETGTNLMALALDYLEAYAALP